MPRVTVFIPTYNWSSVLPYSIGSVLRQSFQDWELLVIGDCCTDDSEQVVAKIKCENGDDPRIRWINLPQNCGQQYGPNNEGIRQAQGEFIAHLNHDDLWWPHHLQCLVKAMDEGDYDLVHSVAEVVMADGRSEIAVHHDRCTYPTTVMHRREMAVRLGGWRDYREIEESPGNDFWRRARQAGFRFGFVRRLSAIKFPAIDRPNVYRLQPNHEQKAWFERIGSEPNLEAERLMELLRQAHEKLSAYDHQLVSQVREIALVKAPRAARQRMQSSKIAVGSRRVLARLKIIETAKGATVRNSRRKRGLE